MGIDVSLVWDGMTDEDRTRQTMIDFDESARRIAELRALERAGGKVTGEMVFSTAATTSHAARGAAGYIREGYSVSPFPSALLVREAYEAADGTAEIPAAVLRERLHSVTEPAARNIGAFMGHVVELLDPDAPAPRFAQTEPATVWESVQTRCQMARDEGADLDPEDLMAGYVAFVELAERKEREQGRPCTVTVSR